MATTDLIGAPERADHPTPTATPTPLSVTRPTAPLPKPAVIALARLERAFLPLDIVRAVTRFEVAAARYDDLIARPASTLSPAEFDALAASQQTMAAAFAVLAEAGRTDLIAPAEAASRYQSASRECRELAASGNYAACLASQDEMAMCRCQLEQAGRLDLIGVTP